ncbi:peptidyl-tRNA hydrolase [Streptomyces sp. NPDC093085]|uniref:peptidyl-tRNA hydrolase n=1 Tax=Streptomyces sp. NPDC093085 TaxID=3155068 RepID=UPI003423D5E4
MSSENGEHGENTAAGHGSTPRYVLPLVVRIEKDAPPSRTDALETAARAVLTLLSDPRAGGTGDAEGEWARAVREWDDSQIRKVVRRARGAEWRRAGTLPGITVRGGGAPGGGGAGAPDTAGGGPSGAAEVRVFPPVPLDGWPKELRKLQVSGTELDDPVEPPPADPAHPVLWLSPHLALSAGKAMAQVGHGAQLAWWELPERARAAWRAAGFPLSVRTAEPAHWRRLLAAGVPVVRDAGYTEIAPSDTVAVEGYERVRSLV